MLIKVDTLRKILRGEVSLAFRRWRRSTIRPGGSLRTAVGVVEIEAVEEIALSRISVADAQNAGYTSRAALLEELRQHDGQVYRVSIRYAGEDPRIALREKEALTDEEFMATRQKLDRLDRSSRSGPWTRAVLIVIRDHPRTSARELAAAVERDKDWFKPNARKLKNLGLTISLEVGYELSPRGAAVLARLEANA